MEIELIVHGKKIMAQIDERQLKEVLEKPNKKTGYEYVDANYYYVYCDNSIKYASSPCYGIEKDEYECGNMYTDKAVAENNARADKLMRNLRRFAAEHGGCPSCKTHKYSAYEISFGETSKKLIIKPVYANYVGNILFMTKEAAQFAIDIFHDELIWYFTEYDLMPEGWWKN